MFQLLKRLTPCFAFAAFGGYPPGVAGGYPPGTLAAGGCAPYASRLLLLPLPPLGLRALYPLPPAGGAPVGGIIAYAAGGAA